MKFTHEMGQAYREGFRHGYQEAQRDMEDFGAFIPSSGPSQEIMQVGAQRAHVVLSNKRRIKKGLPKRKIKQTPKQKLLTKMSKTKWDRYKKGKGKKTYVEIRAEVSRSQAFKKAARRL